MTERTTISRAEAKARGLKRYFTGIPCKHGHVEERNASDSACVECRSIMNKARPTYPWAEWSESRKEHARIRIKAKQKARLAVVREAKMAIGCVDCGIAHPAVLQYHHLRDKTDNVNRMARKVLDFKIIQAEIDKCIVLCANCHAIRHWEYYQKRTA